MKPLSIFVQYASDNLTDNESHGEGLICYSLLHGLAERGHKIFAFAGSVNINNPHPGLITKNAKPNARFPSLSYWKAAFEASRWFSELKRQHKFDLVWRMYPCGSGAPFISSARTPLVLGPLYSETRGLLPVTWRSIRPRPSSVAMVAGAKGWNRVFRQADCLLCETGTQAVAMRSLFPSKTVQHTPVIVSTLRKTTRLATDIPTQADCRLLFVGNLALNKKPLEFCQTVASLRAAGVNASGTMAGAGLELENCRAFIAANGLESFVNLRGHISNLEVASLMAEAHFLLDFCPHSYGRSIVEAMACELPVLCLNYGGPSSFIKDRVNGNLLDRPEASLYAERIRQLIVDPTSYISQFNNAGTTAAAWSADAVLGNLEECFQTVLARDRS